MFNNINVNRNVSPEQLNNLQRSTSQNKYNLGMNLNYQRGNEFNKTDGFLNKQNVFQKQDQQNNEIYQLIQKEVQYQIQNLSKNCQLSQKIESQNNIFEKFMKDCKTKQQFNDITLKKMIKEYEIMLQNMALGFDNIEKKADQTDFVIQKMDKGFENLNQKVQKNESLIKNIDFLLQNLDSKIRQNEKISENQKIDLQKLEISIKEQRNKDQEKLDQIQEQINSLNTINQDGLKSKIENLNQKIYSNNEIYFQNFNQIQDMIKDNINKIEYNENQFEKFNDFSNNIIYKIQELHENDEYLNDNIIQCSQELQSKLKVSLNIKQIPNKDPNIQKTSKNMMTYDTYIIDKQKPNYQSIETYQYKQLSDKPKQNRYLAEQILCYKEQMQIKILKIFNQVIQVKIKTRVPLLKINLKPFKAIQIKMHESDNIETNDIFYQINEDGYLVDSKGNFILDQDNQNIVFTPEQIENLKENNHINECEI